MDATKVGGAHVDQELVALGVYLRVCLPHRQQRRLRDERFDVRTAVSGSLHRELIEKCRCMCQRYCAEVVRTAIDNVIDPACLYDA